MTLDRLKDRLRALFRRNLGIPGDVSGPVWSAVGNILGALTGVAIQMFATLALEGAIVSTIRGDRDGVLLRLLMFLGGLLLVAWLVSRITRTAYTVSTRQVVLRVDVLSVPHFVADLAWTSLGVAWLHSSLTTPDQTQPPDAAFRYGGPAVLLGLAVGLLVLRGWTRASTRGTDS
ncbi:hypothetical protein [Krasilnikovia sp. MM14-A1259]|uniref:hypothetical protein n=1 Tax=Krasilnikovia sp. MM14-A1259 TaxID=3373539 RepID=UPI003804B52F